MFESAAFVGLILATSLTTSVVADASARADVLKTPSTIDLEASADQESWDWGTEFDIILVLLVVYFVGARLGKTMQKHYKSFQKLYNEERLKMQRARTHGFVKLVHDDDVSTSAEGSDLSACSSSDEEEGERVGVVISRDDFIRVRPAKGLPPSQHLHARNVDSKEVMAMPTASEGRWAALGRNERDWTSLRKASSLSPEQSAQLSPRQVKEKNLPPPMFLEPSKPVAALSSLLGASVGEGDQYMQASVTPLVSKKGSLTGSITDISCIGSLRPGSKLGVLRPGGSMTHH